MEMRMVYLDFETTGLSTTRSEIIEVGFIIVDNGKMEYFNDYCLCEGEISAGAVKAHGISRGKLEFLAKGQYFEDLYPAMAKYMQDAAWVGHNILKYDIPLLHSQTDRLGLERLRPAQVIDTLPEVREFTKKKSICTETHTLEFAYQFLPLRLGYDTKQLDRSFADLFQKQGAAHSALYDSYMVMILHELMRKFA